MTVQSIIEELNTCKEEDLFVVHTFILKKIKLLQNLRQALASAQFRPNDRIYWQSKRNKTRVYGRILKINKNTCTVIADDNQKWKVPPSLLTKDNTETGECIDKS